MPILNISLLGSVLFEVNGVKKDIATRKAAALLIYIAVTNQPQRRDSLAALFWPEFDNSRAKASLRRALADIKRGLGPDWLLTGRQMAQLNEQADIQIDVNRFRTLLSDSQVSPSNCIQAIELYRADFLDGFSLKDSLAFDEWQFFERESLRQALAYALETVIGRKQQDGDFQAAVTYARRYISLDPLHEPAQRHLIQAYVKSGQWTAAVRQYDECVRLLDEELGVEPDSATVNLFEQLKNERSQAPAPFKEVAELLSEPKPEPVPEQKRPTELHNLTLATTSFIGREKELAQIANMIADPNVRLLTIMGLGGIGKTRLALQVAQQVTKTQLDQFSGGVWFVDMLAADSEEALAIAIAQTLSLTLRGSASPRDQLLAELKEHNQKRLLILDNFEHLIECASLVSYLLSQTGAIKILVTSREVLDLAEEWLFLVDGLPFPIEPALDDMPLEQTAVLATGQFGAINLFMQRARQAKHDFSFKEEKEQVIAICRLVEGLPLALELAAAWVRMLSCQQIVDKIQLSLDFLSATQRNIPDRHLSIRAVFETSWELMLPHEQDALAQMSIMRGGFTPEAAEAVADASIFTLKGLLNKSLLRARGKNHFNLHELVRQFAADKFELRYVSSEPQLERLMTYYMSLLYQNEETLFGPEQAHTLDLMEPEIDNIYQAWVWAVKRGRIDLLLKGFHSFYNYHSIRSKYLQGERIFAQTIDLLQVTLPESSSKSHINKAVVLLARLLARRGEFLHIVGQLTVAEKVLNEGLLLAQQKNLRVEQELIVQTLGVVLYLQGNYEKAKEFSNQALSLVIQSENLHEVAYAYMNLGAIELALGNLALATKHHQESLKIYEALEYEWGIANSLRFLGTTSYRNDQINKAEIYAKQSLDIFQKLQTDGGTALALNILGMVAQSSGDLEKALELYKQSLQLGYDSNSYVIQANALQNLGLLSHQLNELDQEEDYLYKALDTARKAESTPLMLNIMLDIVPLLEDKGDFHKVGTIMTFIRNHPVRAWETQSKSNSIQGRLAEAGSNLIKKGAEIQTVYQVVEDVLVESQS